ncbi:MAG: PH domain-containing protein, partial [Planctomycetota bacterium]
MKQAIAGVSPADQNETTVMTVWPSNGLYGLGRFFGGLYSIGAGFYVFRVGNLLALLTAPF